MKAKGKVKGDQDLLLAGLHVYTIDGAEVTLDIFNSFQCALPDWLLHQAAE